MGKAEVGTAVAHWYQRVHNAGERLLSKQDCLAFFLTRETDSLDPDRILAIGTAFGLSHMCVWHPEDMNSQSGR